jgi:hypothetical protein
MPRATRTFSSLLLFLFRSFLSRARFLELFSRRSFGLSARELSPAPPFLCGSVFLRARSCPTILPNARRLLRHFEPGHGFRSCLPCATYASGRPHVQSGRLSASIRRRRLSSNTEQRKTAAPSNDEKNVALVLAFAFTAERTRRTAPDVSVSRPASMPTRRPPRTHSSERIATTRLTSVVSRACSADRRMLRA